MIRAKSSHKITLTKFGSAALLLLFLSFVTKKLETLNFGKEICYNDTFRGRLNSNPFQF